MDAEPIAEIHIAGTAGCSVEMLGKLETLSLIGGAEIGPVQTLRPRCHPLVDEPPDHLTIDDRERHVPTAYLQYTAGYYRSALQVTKVWIEKAG